MGRGVSPPAEPVMDGVGERARDGERTGEERECNASVGECTLVVSQQRLTATVAGPPARPARPLVRGAAATYLPGKEE